ncbi:hypothetical protein TNCV_1764721 [Trichonephila clavipes]|nr:hypothetical protein TNCV_1764721 [Trichonephila clavipes]
MILKYCKIRSEETNGMNPQQFFRTSDCIENDTTMEDDPFRQESPVNSIQGLFPEFDLNKFSSCEKLSRTVLKNNAFEYQKKNNGKKNLRVMMMREFSSPEKFTPPFFHLPTR